MAKVRIEWHTDAWNALRKEPGVTNLCREVAETRFAGIAGIDGYQLEPRTFATRNGFAIFANEYPAIADNKKNNTLEKLVR